MGSPDAHRAGVRYRLEREPDSDDPVVYRGEVERGPERTALVVRVARDPASADGWRADAELGAEVAGADALARTAATMVKSAVRRAAKDGLEPPRRIHRWRER